MVTQSPAQPRQQKRHEELAEPGEYGRSPWRGCDTGLRFAPPLLLSFTGPPIPSCGTTKRALERVPDLLLLAGREAQNPGRKRSRETATERGEQRPATRVGKKGNRPSSSSRSCFPSPRSFAAGLDPVTNGSYSMNLLTAKAAARGVAGAGLPSVGEGQEKGGGWGSGSWAGTGAVGERELERLFEEDDGIKP